MSLRIFVSIALFAVTARAALAQCTPVQADELLPNFTSKVRLGTSTAFCGETLIAGAPGQAGGSGRAYVFERHAGGANAWGQVLQLTSPAFGLAFFGQSVELDGDRVFVGAPLENTGVQYGGRVYVFERDQGGPDNWGQVGALVQSDSSKQDGFGYQIAVSGDTAFVSARLDDTFGTNSGAIYLYQRNHGGLGNWGEVVKITASDAESDDQFGTSIVFSGTTLMVSAPRDDDAGNKAGAIYVLERDQGGPNQWGEVKKLTQPSSFFLGTYMAFDANTLVTSSSTGFSAGGFVFERDAGGVRNWGQVGTVLALGDMDLDGDTLLVGTSIDSDCRQQSGSAHLFHRDLGGPDAWGEVAEFYSSDCGRFDSFGLSVALGDDVALIGAPGHDHNKDERGAVYVFTDVVPPPTTYCTAGVSASGCSAALSTSGTPSASSSSGFDLMASTVEGRKDGLFFTSPNGRQANPWGNSSSFQCLVQPVSRGALMTGVGSFGACDGAFVYDLNARWAASPNQNPGAGAVTGAQLWYRDPGNTSNRFTSLSEAIEFVVCP
jgi:hypothetical protein